MSNGSNLFSVSTCKGSTLTVTSNGNTWRLSWPSGSLRRWCFQCSSQFSFNRSQFNVSCCAGRLFQTIYQQATNRKANWLYYARCRRNIRCNLCGSGFSRWETGLGVAAVNEFECGELWSPFRYIHLGSHGSLGTWYCKYCINQQNVLGDILNSFISISGSIYRSINRASGNDLDLFQGPISHCFWRIEIRNQIDINSGLHISLHWAISNEYVGWKHNRARTTNTEFVSPKFSPHGGTFINRNGSLQRSWFRNLSHLVFMVHPLGLYNHNGHCLNCIIRYGRQWPSKNGPNAAGAICANHLEPE